MTRSREAIEHFVRQFESPISGICGHDSDWGSTLTGMEWSLSGQSSRICLRQILQSARLFGVLGVGHRKSLLDLGKQQHRLSNRRFDRTPCPQRSVSRQFHRCDLKVHVLRSVGKHEAVKQQGICGRLQKDGEEG
jgi:hypothetical protein